MAQIGNFGKLLVFKTSSEQIFTFNNFNQKISSRWSSTSLVLKKPLSEFNGPELRKITLTIVLDIALGIKPRKLLKTMESIVEKGTAENLVIGGAKVGANKWVITDLSEEWNVIYSHGELAKATVDVTMEEYVESTSTTKTTSTTTKTSSSTKTNQTTSSIKYTIKKGDTLWALAKKYLGKGTLYTEIYQKNKETIESAAKKHGKSSSENGHWIYPGTVLTIEVTT